jgi:hypothetical protein
MQDVTRAALAFRFWHWAVTPINVTAAVCLNGMSNAAGGY